jgi:small-conductance mechanosensitive channel
MKGELMNTNWKRKLTSRKFWAAVAGFITPIMLAFGVSESITTQVTAIVMAGAAVVAYIIGEGFIDACGKEG